MNYYTRKRRWKYILFLSAAIIGGFTIYYTNQLVDELKIAERKKVELWAEAIRLLSISEPGTEGELMNLINRVISENTTIPVILTDTLDEVLSHNNLRLKPTAQPAEVDKILRQMKTAGYRISIDLGDNDLQYLYYNDSIILQKLTWFPFIQLLVVAIFILVAYLTFSGARKMEQDQVWAGMAKETAHQLGTPTSSLMAWIDLLKLKITNEPLIHEMGKDVERLQIITDRFSKIGSNPDLTVEDLPSLIASTTDYLKSRTSSKVVYYQNFPPHKVLACINPVLFAWVIENVCKNAIDAMSGVGAINISVDDDKNQIIIDITDTGKGIARRFQKRVFEPGYSTKKRGWGLGLSLSKRIINQIHKGKISVLDSQSGSTTFRIVLPKTNAEQTL